MKNKKKFSIEKIKEKFQNIFTINELVEKESFESKGSLRVFSPKYRNLKRINLFNKSFRNSNDSNITNLFQSSTSLKTSNTNNPFLLSKTTSSSNLFQKTIFPNYSIIKQFWGNKTIFLNGIKNESSSIENTNDNQRISFLKNLIGKTRNKSNENNLKMIKTKSPKLISKKNKLNRQEEKMVNGILFDRLKSRNLKNKNANGEICDDVTSQVNLEPFMNSYGKILYDSIRKSDFIINTINVIYPKVSKTHFFIKDLRNKKNEMLRAHSYISFLPLQNNTNNRIYKINPIKRTIKVHSKYPINFSKTNYNHFFYRSKSKQILYDDCKIFKYNDIII